MMTSLCRRGDCKRMEEIGFAAYLPKPTRQADLYECLRAVLARTEALPSPPFVTRHTIREMHRSAVRILLAEDNLTNQQVALGILKKLGLRADVANNGLEAIRALENHPYDLVLMDVQMPEMDGYEAARHIRDPHSAIQNHEVPILAMTAHTMPTDREKCLQAGMNDYLAKPVSPQTLTAALDRWLPKKGSLPKESTVAHPRLTKTPASTAPQLPVFDQEGMMDRLMGDQALAQRVIRDFLSGMPEELKALNGHLAAGDASNAECQAHTIKGAAAQLGGELLRATAQEIEMAARRGDLEAALAQAPLLERHYSELQKAMEAMR